MYKNENGGNAFLFMRFFKKLEGCNKWDVVRFSLNKDGAGEDGLVAAASVVPQLATRRPRLGGMRRWDWRHGCLLGEDDGILIHGEQGGGG
jgi:hypothetical protein